MLTILNERTASLIWLFAAIIAAVEWLGGKRLNAKIRAQLKKWRSQVKTIFPLVGKAEATFALVVIEDIFGRKAISARRLVGSLTLVAVCTVTVTGTYFYVGDDAAIRFSKESWPRQLVFHIPYLFATTWLSLTFAHWLVTYSIRRFGSSSLSTLWFTAVLIVSVLMSLALFKYIAMLNTLMGLFLVGEISVNQFFMIFADRIWPPYLRVDDTIRGLITFDTGGDLPAVDIDAKIVLYIQLALMLLRVLLAITFLGWVLLRGMIALIDLILLRFLQTDQGVLTICSLVVAFISEALTRVFNS